MSEAMKAVMEAMSKVSADGQDRIVTYMEGLARGYEIGKAEGEKEEKAG